MTALEALATTPAIEALGRALLHFLWQGLLLGALAAIALGCLRKCGPSARYAAAGAALLLMIATPVVTFAVLYEGKATTRVSAEVTPSVRASAPHLQPAEPTDAASTFVANIDALPASDGDGPPIWLLWLVAGWLGGVAVLGLRAVGAWLGLMRLRRSAHRPLSEAWQDKVMALARSLGITRSLQVVESQLVSVPAVLGWWRPLILVPCSALVRLSPDQLEAVLAHELAHIRRHDYLVNLVQTAVETLLFYHPAVWWLSRRIREERELCCDDIAASSCGDPVRYARALAELEGCRRPGALALAATGGTGELMARVRRLVGLPTRRRGRWSWSAPPVLGLALVLGLANRVLSPDDDTTPPEPPVVSVSADGKLIQVQKGIPVALRDAAGVRHRDGGLLLVVTPDQQLTVDGAPTAAGTHLSLDERLVISDADGRALWSFRRLQRGDRDVVELTHHTPLTPPLSSSSSPSESRNQDS